MKLRKIKCVVNNRLNIRNRSRYIKDLFTSLLDLSWRWILLFFVISWIGFAGFWYLLMKVNGDFSFESLNETNGSEIRCVVGVKSLSGVLLYSIESQQTIGYGTRSLNENCRMGIFLLIIQSCFGLIIQSLWVGLIYTKLSRPKKRRETLIWSSKSVISIRDGYLRYECRLGDMRRRSTLVEAHVRMYFIQDRLTMENERIPFDLIDMNVGLNEGKDRLFLQWPIIIEHRIDSQSPLYHFNEQTISQGNFEILLILEGMITQAKKCYYPEDIIWGGRFENIFHFDGKFFNVDYSKFNSICKDNSVEEYSSVTTLMDSSND